MIIRKLPLFLGMLVLLSACKQIIHQDANSRYLVNTIEMEWPENAEDVRFRFNILDKSTDEKAVWSELTRDHIDVCPKIRSIFPFLTSSLGVPKESHAKT